jgi:hypothetical protein
MMNHRAGPQNALKRVRKWSQPASAGFSCHRMNSMAWRNLWVPAINNHGGFERWAFIEITDP